MRKIVVKKAKNKENIVEDKLSMMENIEKDLLKDKIFMPEYEDVDQDYLALPNDLTDVPSKELGRYFNTLTQQKIWVRTVIGRTSVYLREKTLELDTAKANIFKELPMKMSIKEKDLSLLLDSNTNELTRQIIYFEEKLNTLNDIVTSLEESIFAVSREITRRGKDFDEFNRNENWGRKK